MRVGVLFTPFPWCLGLCLACLCAVGCGSSRTREQKSEPSLERLIAIRRAYIEATRDLEHPPKDVGELKPYLKGGADLAMLLRSPNDGQEYTILWRVDINTLPPLETTSANVFYVLAYEKQGKDGKRWVTGFRRARQMTEDDFKDAPFPPSYKAPE